MRHCYNENVEVYEVTAPTMSKLLARTAAGLKDIEDDSSYVNMTTYFNGEEYVATVYVS